MSRLDAGRIPARRRADSCGEERAFTRGLIVPDFCKMLALTLPLAGALHAGVSLPERSAIRRNIREERAVSRPWCRLAQRGCPLGVALDGKGAWDASRAHPEGTRPRFASFGPTVSEDKVCLPL